MSNPVLIPLNASAFNHPPSLLEVTSHTAAAKKKAEQRAPLQPILEATLKPSLSREEQVVALRNAGTHPKLHLHFINAGLHTDNKLLYYVLKNINTVLHLATTTTNTRGHTTDDIRSLVQK